MSIHLIITDDHIEYYYFSNSVYWKNNDYPISPIYHTEHMDEITQAEGNAEMNSAPIVSVIMTTYNCSKYLHTSIPSILNQTMYDIEFIIIDDNSTDNTKDIISHFATKDKRIKPIYNSENKGCYTSKNMAIRHATAQWITFQDADDYSNSTRLEKQFRYCLQQGLKCCYCEYLSRKTKKYGLVEISLFIEKNTFDQQLGFFDSVRFGADTEIRGRITLLRIPMGILRENLYHCVDKFVDIGGRSDSLTNSTNTHLQSEVRKKYRQSFDFFHKNVKERHRLKYHFPQTIRPFPIYGLSENEKKLF